MKKLLTLLLACLMCLTLCGCKSSQVKETEALIDAIGTVTADSRNAIAAAEEAFAMLPEEDWGRVKNYETLVAARTAYNAMHETVTITTENWENYFELVTDSKWRENAIGEATQVRELRDFKVKDEYARRIRLEDSYLTLHFTVDGLATTTQVDWNSRSYTEADTSAGSKLRPGTASFVWPGMEEEALIAEIYVGYSALSNPRSDAEVSQLFVFSHTLSAVEGSITYLK